MKYSEKKKERKKELEAESASRDSMSPFRKKLLRSGIELGISLLGVLLIFLCRAAFYSFVGTDTDPDGAVAVITDNFELYYKISLILCGVLLLLTLLSSFTYLFQKNVSRFQKLTVSASPIICSVTVFVLSVFYAYLTAGGIVSIAGYLVLLGLGEAMLFRLPCAVYVSLRKSTDRTGNIK